MGREVLAGVRSEREDESCRWALREDRHRRRERTVRARRCRVRDAVRGGAGRGGSGVRAARFPRLWVVCACVGNGR